MAIACCKDYNHGYKPKSPELSPRSWNIALANLVIRLTSGATAMWGFVLGRFLLICFTTIVAVYTHRIHVWYIC